jgi:mannitol-1-phosphate 5-dehydrogenase
MSAKTALIFGAGKIARGFIAHLLTLSGFHITFVEKSPALVSLLRERQKYKVHVMGAPEKDIVIEGFETLSCDEVDLVAKRLAPASVVFVSIGGLNLPQVAPMVAAGVRQALAEERIEPLNVILCENYFQPAKWLRQLVAEHLNEAESSWSNTHLGIVEALVLRSSVEPTPEMKAGDPLSLKVQDMWDMPADKDAFIGEIPQIRGLSPQANFEGGLVRKLFTYNAINALIAYVGHLKGYTLLSDAANDPELVELARVASGEAGKALCETYGFDAGDQHQFAESAIAKYQKREIVDPIERNARDPLRKLSRNDRLVGPACLAFKCGIRPVALSRAIGAALHYDNAGDPAARKLQAMIKEIGIGKTIHEVCGIDPQGELAHMIIDDYRKWNNPRKDAGSAPALAKPM